MKLFVDENLSPRLAKGLAGFFDGDHEVAYVVTKFDRRGVSNEEWIGVLGREGGWCVLSGDRRIAKNRVQRDAFARAGLTGFFPAPALMKVPVERLGARILILWPKIEATASTIAGGCYELGITGDRLKSL